MQAHYSLLTHTLNMWVGLKGKKKSDCSHEGEIYEKNLLQLSQHRSSIHQANTTFIIFSPFILKIHVYKITYIRALTLFKIQIKGLNSVFILQIKICNPLTLLPYIISHIFEGPKYMLELMGMKMFTINFTLKCCVYP